MSIYGLGRDVQAACSVVGEGGGWGRGRKMRGTVKVTEAKFKCVLQS